MKRERWKEQRKERNDGKEGIVQHDITGAVPTVQDSSSTTRGSTTRFRVHEDMYDNAEKTKNTVESAPPFCVAVTKILSVCVLSQSFCARACVSVCVCVSVYVIFFSIMMGSSS
jgi:hypothetical protein